MNENNKIIAHRGVFDNESIIENTKEAFQEAIKRNIPFELDIQLTLFESQGTPISEISMTTLPEKSQRYINNQRRNNK